MKTNSHFWFITVLLISAPLLLFGQSIGINDDGSGPDNSAMLDVKSTTKGMLIPRMTTAQIGSIVNPADGLQAYNTDNGKVYVFVSSANVWKELSYGAGTINPLSCSNTLFDSRDGKSYAAILIGTQCWMAQNLNIGTRINGGNNPENNSSIEKYCFIDLESYCDIYGGLYQWNEAMQYSTTEGAQGICPTGWHIPTDAEWSTLTTYLGGESVASGKLKEKGTTHWFYPNAYATNQSGFTALPGGVCDEEDGFLYIGLNGYWWSTSEGNTGYAWSRLIHNYNGSVVRNNGEKDSGFSVRCLRDF